MEKPLEDTDQKSFWVKRRASVRLDCGGARVEAWRHVRRLREYSGKRPCGSK